MQSDAFYDYLSQLNYGANEHTYLRSSTRIQPLGIRKQEQVTSEKSSSKMAKFEEIMTCFICLTKLQNPHLCPCCSKLCCHGCITKWLTENKQVCPHCRSVLRVHQLINCRFLDEIGTVIQSTPPPSDPCPNHQQSQLQYYCITCSEPVCSECAMFSSHKQHDFEHIQKVFDQKVKDVSSQVEEVNGTLRSLKDNLRNLDELIDKLNRGKDEKVQEIQQYTEQLLAKLELTHQQRFQVLLQQKQNLNNKINQIHNTKEQVSSLIQNCKMSQLITQSDALIRKVKDVKDQHNTQPQLEVVNLEFQSEIIPQYVNATFELTNFSSYETNAIVYSPSLVHNMIKWRLKVYPNGNGNAKDTYLSVFLEMGDNPIKQAKRYEYKVEMLNHKHQNSNVVREFASEFESGECWGYNRFYRIDLLKREGYISEDDTVTFRFFVRAPTYFSESQDQLNFIDHLKRRQRPSSPKQQEESQSYQSVSEMKPPQEDLEGSSTLKLREEIGHYAQEIHDLQQESEVETSRLRVDSQSSSECYDFETEEIEQFQTKIIKQEQPIRRNLIKKFELEAKENHSQNSPSSHSSLGSQNVFSKIEETKEFLDQLQKYSRATRTPFEIPDIMQ